MNEEHFFQFLQERLQGILDLSPGQLGQLYAHFRLLKLWNQRLNLTSIRDDEEILTRHYCECLFLAAVLPANLGSFCDVGAGAGFPGIPLAIARPSSRGALIESHQRKAVFLKEFARGLPNVRVLAMRAESVGESYDWVVSRAVRPADVMRLLPRLGERFALLAGAEDADALSPEKVLPVPWGERRVVVLGYVPRETSPGARDVIP